MPKTTYNIVSGQKDKWTIRWMALLQQIMVLFVVIDTNGHHVVHFYLINHDIAHWCFSMYHLPSNIIIQYCGHNVVSIDLSIVQSLIDYQCLQYKWLSDNDNINVCELTWYHMMRQYQQVFTYLMPNLPMINFVWIWHVCFILYIEEFAFVFPLMNVPISLCHAPKDEC